MPWETLTSETRLSHPHLTVVTERVRTPTREQEWTTVRRKQAVVVAPITATGRIVLVQQERISIRTVLWEMPAGQIDDPDHSAKAVALRELREETGYELEPAGKLIPIGDFYASPGMTNEHQFLFAARPVARTTSHALEAGILDCREFSIAEVVSMIANGTIRDANTLSCWAQLLARGVFS